MKFSRATIYPSKGLSHRRVLYPVPLLLIVLLVGCAQPVDLELPLTDKPTRSPTGEPALPTVVPGPTSLIVCLGREPESLYRYGSAYLYGGTGREAETVLQAIYDGPLDIRQYEYHPVILDKLPSLSDGDARIGPVSVGEGDVYLNPLTLQPEQLDPGDPYLPAGCQSSDCIQTYAGGTVSMDQLEAEFRIRPDVAWSDGEPVSATDSVFSFEIDRDVDSPTPKTQVDRTLGYEALDSRTVRWTGIPGYNDAEYVSNFWSPLPRHHLADLSAAELLVSDETNFSPLGWGPYVIQQWRPGEDITLTRNSNYFRAAEGLPAFDVLQFRFLAEGPRGSIDQLLTRECDILDESAIADALGVEILDPAAVAQLVELSNARAIELAWTPSAEMERLDFGLSPVLAARLPILFDDPRTRAAISSCIDREGLISSVVFGLSELPNSYLPPSHPLASPRVEPIEFDPAAGRQQLDEIGWLDLDEDPSTPRTAASVAGIKSGAPLTFSLLTTQDEFHRATATRLVGDLADCGIEVTPEVLPQAELFEPWPDGPTFGRTFQAVSWAWPSWVSPLCEMYASREIPSEDSPFGVNASGYSDTEFDRACSTILLGRPDSSDYLSAVEGTETIYRESLPSIPLYMRPRVIAHRAEICGINVDPLSFSMLWNIEELVNC